MQPNAKLWTGNPNQELSVNNGNVAFDDGSTSFDSLTEYFDGTIPANITSQNIPNGTLWAVTES